MGTVDPNDLPALRFADTMSEALYPMLERCTLPIVGVREDALDESRDIVLVSGARLMTQRGTGTLFRIGDHGLLVTACHVFRTLEGKGELPYTRYDNPAGVFRLYGLLHVADDPFDIAVMDLDTSVVDALFPNRFLSLANVDFRADPGKGWYFLHGIPFVNTYTSPDLLTTLQTDFTYRTGLYAGSTSGFRDYDPNYHVLLAMDGEYRHSDDLSRAEPPTSLGGISGSSIWLGFSEDHYMDDWTPDLAKVVAVQTKTYTDRKVAQGTRWRAVAALLWQVLTELHEELFKHLPSELIESLCNRQ